MCTRPPYPSDQPNQLTRPTHPDHITRPLSYSSDHPTRPTTLPARPTYSPDNHTHATTPTHPSQSPYLPTHLSILLTRPSYPSDQPTQPIILLIRPLYSPDHLSQPTFPLTRPTYSSDYRTQLTSLLTDQYTHPTINSPNYSIHLTNVLCRQS